MERASATQIVVSKPLPDQGGRSQLRKQAESQDDKYRVTHEARQVITGTFTKLQTSTMNLSKRNLTSIA